MYKRQLVDNNSKEKIKFLSDEGISRKVVGQTCERCDQTDCEERAASAIVYENQKRKESKDAKLLKIFESL